MKIKLEDLRQIIKEVNDNHSFAGLKKNKNKNKVGISSEYVKKEKIREELQQMIVNHVTSGNIVDQQGLEQYYKNIEMALLSLKMIPLEVWNNL